MAHYQFRKVKLIDPQDIVYLDFCTECALKKQTLKPKLPPTAINKLSLFFEDLMRDLLTEHFSLSPKRILSFEERCNQFGYIQKYREIDAVSVERSQPDLLFEIKTSSNPNPQTVIRKAKKQLKKSQYIASHLGGNLKLCIIYIDIFPKRMLNPSELSLCDVDFHNTLDSLQENMLEETTSCVIFPGIKVWHLAVERELIDNLSLWTEAQTEIEQNEYKRREREALIAKGIPSEEFPEFLRQANQTQTASKIIQFGEFNGETVLGNAFRNAQRKQKSHCLIAQ